MVNKFDKIGTLDKIIAGKIISKWLRFYREHKNSRYAHKIRTEDSKEGFGSETGLPKIDEHLKRKNFKEEDKFIEEIDQDEEDSASKLNPPSFNHFEKEENTIDPPKYLTSLQDYEDKIPTFRRYNERSHTVNSKSNEQDDCKIEHIESPQTSPRVRPL